MTGQCLERCLGQSIQQKVLAQRRELHTLQSIRTKLMPMYTNGQTENVAACKLRVPMILIIDDDPAILGLLAVVLRREGFECDLAVDGAEAEKKLRITDYDAILLDLMLPRQNGFELIRFLKAERRAMLERVIVVTAVAEITLRDFTDQKLVCALLRKPFDLHQLVETVTTCAENAIAQRSKEAALGRWAPESVGA
jgi:CheY-like chemotaxis protein